MSKVTKQVSTFHFIVRNDKKFKRSDAQIHTARRLEKQKIGKLSFLRPKRHLGGLQALRTSQPMMEILKKTLHCRSSHTEVTENSRQLWRAGGRADADDPRLGAPHAEGLGGGPAGTLGRRPFRVDPPIGTLFCTLEDEWATVSHFSQYARVWWIRYF